MTIDDDVMAKGALGDFARGVAHRIGIYKGNLDAVPDGAETHAMHAETHRMRAITAQSDTHAAAHLALANAHGHMARAVNAYERGQHEQARKSANLAAQHHQSAAGHDAGLAAQHGAHLRRSLGALSEHVRGVQSPKAPSAPAPRAAAPSAPKRDTTDYAALATHHRNAQQALKPHLNHPDARTHNALHALAAGHAHAADAAEAMHAGLHREAGVHLQRAAQAHATAMRHDPGTTNARGANLQHSLTTLGAPMSKAAQPEPEPQASAPGRFDAAILNLVRTLR